MTPANVKTLIITIQSTPGQIQPVLPFQGCPSSGRCICTPMPLFSQVFSDNFSPFFKLSALLLEHEKIKGLSHVKEGCYTFSASPGPALFLIGNENFLLRKRKFQPFQSASLNLDFRNLFSGALRLSSSRRQSRKDFSNPLIILKV